jgi:hypothetical protein
MLNISLINTPMENPQVVDENDGQMWRVIANLFKREVSSFS